MDQVKKYLAVAGKYHFWILLVLVLAISFSVRRMAGSALNEATASEKGKLESSFSQMQSLASAQNVPNASFVDGVKKDSDQVQFEANKAWSLIYGPQSALFQWPDLGSENFRRFMQTYKWGEVIPPPLAELYQAHMWEQVPQLYDILNLRREVKIDPAETGPNAETETKGVVDWDKDDRKLLEDRYQWKEIVPTTKAILFAQEDFWMYQLVLLTIAKTNGETDYLNAAIRRINYLGLGARAQQGRGMFEPFTLPVPGAAPVEKVELPKIGDADAAQENARYCDDKGKALAAREAAAIKYYTYVPVFLDLLIDEHKLPDLIVNLANAPLRIQVLQLEIREPNSDGAATKKTTANAPAAKVASTDARESDQHVQLFCTVCIVNPPDVPATEGTPAEGAAPGAAGAVPGAVETPAAPEPVAAAGTPPAGAAAAGTSLADGTATAATTEAAATPPAAASGTTPAAGTEAASPAATAPPADAPPATPPAATP